MVSLLGKLKKCDEKVSKCVLNFEGSIVGNLILSLKETFLNIENIVEKTIPSKEMYFKYY